jgi:general stress protein 26
VVVDDPESHHARATATDAEVLGPVHSAFEGRQRGYSARDLEGNLWSFGTSRIEEGEPVADKAELARQIIETSRYLTLATADASGRPWASPVFFAPGRPAEFLWVSRPDADHSRNIAERAEVSLAIFDSRQPPGTGQGVYVGGRAELVEDGEGIEAYSETSRRWGAPR